MFDSSPSSRAEDVLFRPFVGPGVEVETPGFTRFQESKGLPLLDFFTFSTAGDPPLAEPLGFPSPVSSSAYPLGVCVDCVAIVLRDRLLLVLKSDAGTEDFAISLLGSSSISVASSSAFSASRTRFCSSVWNNRVGLIDLRVSG